MKIIVVDDESTALHLFLDEAMKSDQSVDFHFFQDDAEAILSYCKNNDVGGAILDARMPSISGIDLARELIQVKPDIKIIFLTGTSLTLKEVPSQIAKNVLSVVYKPLTSLSLGMFLDQLKSEKSKIEAKTFGAFDCFLYGKPIHFSSSKSKELFALLVIMRGKSVTMEQAITSLWPDKDLDKAKILYRDAVWRLRSTLEEAHCPAVRFSRALLSLDRELVSCDYYDLCDGKRGTYAGPFLPNYEWAADYDDEIESMRQALYAKN